MKKRTSPRRLSRESRRSFFGKSKEVKRGQWHKPRVEQLESRMVLAVIFSSPGPSTVNVIGDGESDFVRLQVNAAGHYAVSDNGGPFVDTGLAVTTPLAIVNVNLGGGDNRLGVEHNGPGGFVGGSVNFQGGPGANDLAFLGAATSLDNYSVRSSTDGFNQQVDSISGRSLLFAYSDVNSIRDENTGPLAFAAGGADNAISITGGNVSIDGGRIDFANSRTSLTIIAGGGSDTINVRAENPNFTSLTVDGGDPTASDTLIINGTPAANAINFAPTFANAGSVTVAGQPTVSFEQIEHVTINGQAGGDTLTMTTPAGQHHVTYTPGPAPDGGTITSRGTSAGSTEGVPLTFFLLGNDGSVNFASGAVGAREDFLELNGTENSDIFSNFFAPFEGVQIVNAVGAAVTNRLNTGGISGLELHGLGGDDLFTLTGPLPYNAGVFIEGDDPSASDVLNFTGGGGAIALDLAAKTITETGLGPVSIDGVEQVNIDANAALTVTGTAGDDTISVQPTAAGAGNFTVTSGGALVASYPQFTYTDASPFTVDGGSGGVDVLEILGNDGQDFITSAAGTITRAGGTVTLGAGLDRLEIKTFEASDFITLAGITIPTVVDAGDQNDTVDGSAMATPVNAFGGQGTDTLIGGSSNDRLEGGDGDDVLTGNAGDDILLGGDGVDHLAGGDGFNTIEGGDGSDIINSTSGIDIIDGGSGDDLLNFDNGVGFYDVYPVFGVEVGAAGPSGAGLAAKSVEEVSVGRTNTTGDFRVRDLTGTPVRQVNLMVVRDVNFVSGAFPAGAITIEGSPASDAITAGLGDIFGGITAPVVDLAWGRVHFNPGAQGSQLVINGDEGDDSIRIEPTFPTGATVITLNGGVGNDVLEGADIENGGDGDDVLKGAAGNDTLNGGAGNDTYIPQGGQDTVTDPSGQDVILMTGTGGNDIFNIILTASGTDLAVTTNGLTTIYPAITGAGINRIIVQGLEGVDALTVNSTNGAVPVSVDWNGGSGLDTLFLSGGTAVSNVHAVGSSPGEGTTNIAVGNVNQNVTFSESELVFDSVDGPLVISATAADNAINFSASQISIDNFWSTFISNKSNVTILGNAGSDTFNINGPSGLSGTVLINGGDPAGSDTLIVSSVAGTDDEMQFTPSAQGAGAVSYQSATPNVGFSAIEQLTVALQIADNDGLDIEGTAGNDQWEYTPGATSDAGTITGTMNVAAPFPMVPTTFVGLDMAADNLQVNDDLSGGADTLIFNGTSANDSIAVDAGGGILQVAMQVNNNLFTDLETFGLSSLRVRGLDGDDTITHGANGVAINVPVTYEGGNPSSGSDVLFLTGRTGVAESVTIAPDAANTTEQDVTGLGAAINVSGIELIRYTGVGADDTLQVAPGSGDDFVRVDSAPGGFGVDMVTAATLPTIQYTGLNTIEINALGQDTVLFKTLLLEGALPGNYRMLASFVDTMIIEGGDGGQAEDFLVTAVGPDAVAVRDAGGPGVTVTAVNFAGGGRLGRLQLNTLGGDDTVTVDVADEAGAGNGIVGTAITFDGGLGSDRLTVQGNPSANGETAVGNVIYSPGPATTEGRLLYQSAVAATLMTIDYVNLEPVVDLVPAAILTVNGTNADNAINYSAGSVGGRGLVSVDEFETIEFASKTTLVLNGQAGSDEINVGRPATTPTGLTSIIVNGGDPTGSDEVIVNGTTGSDTLNILPATFDSATVTGLGPIISISQAEHLLYNGRGGHDALTVTLPSFSDVDVIPGATENEGSIRMFQLGVNTLLPLDWVDMGHLLPMTFAGAPTRFTLHGTAESDQFNLPGFGPSQLQVVDRFQFSFRTPGINVSAGSSVKLLGLDGDDEFNITGTIPFPLIVDGGNPSASDVLNFTATGTGPVTVNFGAGTVSEAGSPAVSFVGVEVLNVNAAGEEVNIVGTGGDDVLDVSPTSLSSGTVALISSQPYIGSTPVVNFSNASPTAVNVNLGSGDDKLKVQYSSNPETINVDVQGGSVTTANFIDVNFTGVDSLDVFGHEGDDTFNVTPLTASGIINVVNGGFETGDFTGWTLATTADGTLGGGGTTPVVAPFDTDNDGSVSLAAKFAVGDTTPPTASPDQGGSIFQVVNLQDGFLTISADIASDFSLGVGTTDGGLFELLFDGVVVDSHQFGSIFAGSTQFATLSAVVTNVVAGPHEIRVRITRDDFAHFADTFQYLDDVSLGGSATIAPAPQLDIPVFIDGGDPIGSTPGDTINIINSTFVDVSHEQGPENDEGSFFFRPGDERVSYDHIEGIGPISNSDCVLILGTNGDDDITVIARDASYIQPGDPIPAGLDGIRDFTVSINGGPEILYIDVGGLDTIPITVTGQLFLDGLAGDDDIVIRAPAPNGASWAMNVHVAGGPPAAATGDQGDVLELETPGTNTVVFTPTGVDSGTILLDQTGAGVLVGDTLITIGTFTNACPSSPTANDGYNSSPGGVEQIVYQGLEDFVTSAQVTAATIFNPGANYSVGDILTVQGGTGTAATLVVTSAPGGSIASVSVLTPGTYTAVPANPVSVVGGTGTGATFNLTLSGTPGLTSDNLTINGTPVDDLATINPANGGSGSFASGASPAFSFVGANAVTVTGGAGGTDVAEFVGTAGNDAITSAANVVTLAGAGTLMLGAGIDQLRVVALAGNDSVNASGVLAPITATIFGGDGNDNLTGSPQDDLIFGGFGDDILVGGAGSDTQYGEDGDDVFGNAGATTAAALAANGVADDAGTDFNFGGPGFDNFVWEPGDGADFNNGGEDGADIFRFFGDASVNAFTLRQGGTPTHFNALIGALVIDNHGVEDVIVDGRGGADTFLVNDLFATEVVSINLNLGAADAGAIDAVTVDGRNLADNLLLSNTGVGSIGIQGLRYNVNVTNAEATDTLAINGNNGDDVIHAGAGVDGTLAVTLNGNDGNDVLSGALIENGGDGDDVLKGSSGNDTLNGGAGDDVLIISAGADTMIGGSGFDIIRYQGTEAADTLTLSQAATTITVSGLIAGTIDVSAGDLERVDVLGQGSGDTISGSNNVALPMYILAGDGNDTVTGGSAADTIYGGFGDDILVGGGGNDYQYGEDGDDVFGNPGATMAAAITANGVADDAGTDFNFGGPGFDNFVWEPGDGPDFNNGGEDAADIFRFFGDAGVNAFTLQSGGTATHFNALIGAVTIDNHGVEDVVVDGRGGADSFTVNDLYATEVVSINLVLGAAGSVNPVTINGRNVGDNVVLSTPAAGAISVQGLRYNVNVSQAEATDTLRINGNNGDDLITAAAGTSTVMALTLAGGEGNDTLNASGTTGTGVTLEGDAGDDTLIGGSGNDTMRGEAGAPFGNDTFVGNGGTDAVGAGGGLIGDRILVSGSPGNDVISMGLNAAGHLVVTINGLTTTYTDFVGGPISTSGVDRILVEGGLGDDSLQIDDSQGLISVAIEYNAGEGRDSLQLLGGSADLATYSPGPRADEGQIVHQGGGVSQQIFFTGLEPILDSTAAAELIVNGTNADNAINYTGPGPNSGQSTTGVVTVDGFESYEFTNKTQLTINGLAGSDTINLNNATTPTGLTTIAVSGGDPPGTDLLIVTGTSATVTVNTSAQNILGATGATVNYVDIEALSVVAGAATTLSVTRTSPVAPVTYVLTPDVAADKGTITTDTIPISFDDFGAGKTINLAGDAGGGDDDVVINGTEGEDVFSVAATTGNISLITSGLARATITTTSIEGLTLNALAGDDTFNVTGPQSYGSITLAGGDPSASDVANLAGDGTGIFVVFGPNTTVAGGGLFVNLPGVEILNLDANGGNVAIFGTAGDDTMTVSPTGPSAATARLTSSAPDVGSTPVVNVSDIGVLLADLGAGSDNLIVTGTQGADEILVTGSLVTVDPNGAAAPAALETVNYDNVENLEIHALAGDDTIDVFPSPDTTIFIDGGDPIGTTPGDCIEVHASAVLFEPGPERDEGGFVTADAVLGPLQRVSFDHIECVIIDTDCALVLGTNGDDDITIIARDASTHAGADGVQDFTVVVNDGVELLFVNTPELHVDALAGDDDIVLREPAPNNAVWDVDVFIAGGPPAAETGDQGDVFEYETPGTQTIIYSPNVPAGVGNATIENVTTSTVIVLAPFVDACPPLNYDSSPGGIEQIVYQGLGGGDTLTMNGTAQDDNFTVNLNNGGSGSHRANLSPIFDYTGANLITVNGGSAGFDDVDILGTDGSDVVTSTLTTVSMGGGTLTFPAGGGIDELNILTFGGTDDVALAVGINTTVDLGPGNDLARAATAAAVRLTLLGGTGDDALFGGAGADRLEGGEGDDTMVGGGGDDFAYGGAGSDTFVWNPGDADDLFEGDDGDDRLAFAGANGNDTYVISGDNGRVLFQRQPGSVAVNMGGVENIFANSETIELSGRKEVPENTTTSSGFANFTYNPATGTFDMRVFVTGLNPFTNSHIHMNIPGGNGPVVIDIGPSTNYTPTNGGLLFTATNLTLASINPPAGFTAQQVLMEILLGRAYYNVHSAANPGGEIRGNIIVSGPSAGSGGADSITVRDTTGTSLQNITFDAGNEAETLAGAALTDTVTVEGLNTADHIVAARVNPFDNNYLVTGLPYNVLVTSSDGTATTVSLRDLMVINGNGGDDSIKALPTIESLTQVTLNGNQGDDLLSADATLNGGDGDDFLEGGAGNDAMDGGAGDDTFVGNGGTDAIGGGTGSSVGDTILVAGTSGADAISLSLNATGHLIVTVNGFTTTYTNFQAGPIATSGIEQILVQGKNGNDTLTVDSTNGAIPILVTYDGGDNRDLLILTGGTATSDNYSVGPNPGQGTSTIVIGAVTQEVRFSNLEPVIDLVAGPLVVTATHANNAINYSVGRNDADTANDPTRGRVSVDGFETIYFSNKTTLTINALAGTDTINLNNSATPTGLTAITVNAGDPTDNDSDKVIVNGTTGNDTVTIDTISIEGARITGLGPTVNVSATERLVYSGQGGDDSLTVTTPTGGEVVTVTPGTVAGEGSIALRTFGAPFGNGNSLLPIDFTDISSSGSLTFADAGGVRIDDLTIYGTDESNIFGVGAAGLVTLSSQSAGASGANRTRLIPVSTPGVAFLELRGLEGDDIFNVAGNHPFPAPGGILVDGGDPSASDVLNFTGSATVANVITQNFGAATVQEATFQPVSYSGVEILNIDAATHALAVVGTASDDSVTVTVASATSGHVENGVSLLRLGEPPQTQLSPIVNYTNITGALNVNLAAGEDRLAVVGNVLNQTINVNASAAPVVLPGGFPATPANTVQIDDGGNLSIDGTVTYSGTEALQIAALEGDDIIQVAPGPIPVFVDGGDPIGVLPGDTLFVGGALGFFAGPESDEGGFLTDEGTISFDHIESLIAGPNGPCPFLIVGTNGDDDITVIARDASFIIPPAPVPAGLDGVQDFTVSVNAGPDILFIDEPDLYIDALNGDDDIVIRTPAPNDVDWDVNVRVAGGPPSTGEPNEGDRLVLETPGEDIIEFRPTGPDTGSIVINEDGVANYQAAGTDSIITFGPFVFICDDPVGPPIEFTYNSSPGGVELVEYDGELTAGAATDDIFIFGTPLDDTTTISPVGVGPGGSGQGTFVSPGSPLFNFRGFDNSTVDGGAGGFDIVQIQGTLGPDTITSTAGTITVNGAGTVTIGATMDRTDLFTFDGNDTITLTSFTATSTQIFAGNGDDTVTGSPQADLVFAGAGNDTIVGGAGDDTVYGEAGNDTITGGLGADQLKGGDDFDTFNWTDGDGADIVDGGSDGADIAVINGSAAVDTFAVSPGASQTHLNVIVNAVTIDYHGVEQINLAPLGGADTVTINDISSTEVAQINVGVDAGLSADADQVIVQGRDFGDNIMISTSTANRVDIIGLPYNIQLRNVEPNDTLTVNGNDGNDAIKAVTGVEAQVAIVLNGNLGDDSLSADAILNGNEGDDYLEGGSGADTINGGPGEDLMIGLGGADTFDGGPDFDTILVRGTSGRDAIDINQTSATNLLTVVTPEVGAVQTENDTLVLVAGVRTVEAVRVEAGQGDDTIRVSWADILGVDATVNSLRIDVLGGPASTRDRLGVVDAGTGDLVLYRKGPSDDTGSITVGPGNAEPLEMTFIEVEYAEPIAAADGDVVVFKHDPFEFNNARTIATFLGANEAINVDPTIDPGVDPFFGFPGDQDWYRVVAEKTGTLDFQVYFRQVGPVTSGRPGLPNSGNLDIQVTDASGDVITGFGTNDNTDDERVRIPAVQGQTYYLRVFANGTAINNYNISITNEAAPTPFDLELEDIIYQGSVAAGTSTTVFTGNAGLPAIDDFFNGKVVSFKFDTVTANLRGEEAVVLDYVGATRQFTLAFPLSATPAAGDTFQVESVDTGRNNNDNITRDNTPTIFLRVADSALLNDIPDNNGNPGSPPDEVISIPFVTSTANNSPSPGFRVAVFRTENDTHTQVGYAQQVPGSPGNYTFTFPTPIPDGSHFISARVEMIDPATPEQAQGFGAFAQSLEIFVDTVEPPISFGEPDIEGDGLTPDSDTFVIPNPDTVSDLITSDLTPAFWGRAEADATVRLYADAFTDLNNNGVFDFTDVNNNGIFDPGTDIPSDIPPNGVFDINTDVFLGQDTAIPLDGNQQEPNGFWQIQTVVNFNDPRFFIGIGGSRLLFATAEDVAGNVNDNLEPVELEIFIDVQGPQVTDVTINGTAELLGLTAGNTLVQFNSDSPNTINSTIPVVGVAPGFTLRAMDILPVPRGNFRPGTLFGLATNGAGTSAQVYVIVAATGLAAPVGNAFGVSNSAGFGFDFNPTSGLLRIINSSDQNLRFDVSTGTLTTDTPLSSGDNVGAAYDRNDTDPETPTTLFTIDFTNDTLARQGGINGIPSPNGGLITTIGSLGVNTDANVGFDIARGSNFAYAAMNVGGVSGFYTINLATGAADLVGSIGNGATPILGLTALPEYDLFDPKPSTDGPTPPVNSIVISFRDLPVRTQQFLVEALKVDVADTPGIYRVIGDQNGLIPIVEIIVTNQPPLPGEPALATVELVFRDPGPDGAFNTPDDIGAPLPDDRFTLIVDDEIIDLAGNHLDGESNAAEPQEFPSFPSGDGIPGGDFIARFTIDSRPEIGNYSAGSAFIDINGNYFIDTSGDDDDYTNRDLSFQIGTVSDSLFAGKFEPADITQNDNDGFDKLGAYGYDNFAKEYRFLLDFNYDGAPDIRIVSAFQVNAIAVAGEFAFNHPGDELGLFDGKNWYLDTNGDNVLDTKIVSNMQGNPIVGDFNGDGSDDLATYDAGRNIFFFDTNRDGQSDDSIAIGGPVNGYTELPIAGDLNLDGVDDLGIWVPNRQGSPTPTTSEWNFLISDRIGTGLPGSLPSSLFDPYAPTPLGNDVFAQFGDHFSLPIFGNFDPPVADSSIVDTATNTVNKFDVNGDGYVAPDDVLMVINQINTDEQPITTLFTQWMGPYMDVDADSWIAPADALEIINYINAQDDQPEGESAVDAAIAADTDATADGLSDDLLYLLASDAATSKKKN